MSRYNSVLSAWERNTGKLTCSATGNMHPKGCLVPVQTKPLQPARGVPTTPSSKTLSPSLWITSEAESLLLLVQSLSCSNTLPLKLHFSCSPAKQDFLSSHKRWLFSSVSKFCTGITAREADFLYDERMFCIHPFRELLLHLWGSGVLYLIIHLN